MKKKLKRNQFPDFVRGLSKVTCIMKLTLFLILLNVCVAFSSTYSQQTKFTLSGDNVSIRDVLANVESKSEFRFFFNSALVDLDQRVSYRIEEGTILELLDQILQKNGIQYEVKDRTIILSPKSSDEPGIAAQQQSSVSGKVTDSSGSPLPGVTVVIKGTTQGTITDPQGNYTLPNAPGNATLQFSFVGMKTQEIAISGKTAIDVMMVDETVGIEEVVAVGYGTQKKANLIGSVVEVKSDKLVNIPSANVTSLLAGKLPGIVSRQLSGEPGADAANISIRGFGNALTIVDGVERNYNQIDPNEIESISVLKDASAAIYGARAGNGVILVTTKRGSSGKPVINFSFNNGWQSSTRMPRYVNSGEFAESYNDALRNSGSPLQFTDYQIKAYKYVSGDKSVTFTDAERAQFEGEKANYVNTDWVDVVFRPAAPMQQYNLSSSGGSEKIKYFISLGYLDQNSVLRSGGDRLRKYSCRSNIDAQITKNLSIGLDVSGRLELLDYPQCDIGQIWNNFMSDPPTNAVGPNPNFASGMGQGAADPDICGTRKTKTTDLSGSISINYSVPFIKGLSAKARLDYLTVPVFQKNFFKAYDIYSYNPVTDTYTYRFAGASSTTSLTQTWTQPVTMVSKLFLNYEHVFGKHSVKALVVGEFTDFNSNTFSAYRTDFYTTAIEQLFAGSSTGQTCTGTESADGRISYAGRFNYEYSNKYLLETTFRYDASPRFARDVRWGFFPSVMAGWRLSEENFIKNNLQFVNNLKLRVSYGQAGVDNIASYNYMTGYQYSGGFVDNSELQLGLTSKGLANLSTTWEKHITYNAGIDFGLLNDMLYGAFDVFYKERSGILTTRSGSLPSTFGANLPSENLNSANYRGFEFQLGYRDKIREIEYSIDGNIAWNRGKYGHVEESDFSGSDQYTRLRYQNSGQWISRYFGLEDAGLFQSQAEIDAWPVIQDNNNNTTLRPGDVKYLDFDGDNKITDLDYHVIGKGDIPEITYGLNISGKWKEFDLSMLWQGATNYSVIEPGMRPYQFTPSTMSAVQLDYWTPENTDARYPRIGISGFNNNKYSSTFWLIDAYYVRLKNIQLGYSLPKLLYKRIGVSELRLYVSAVNLLTISNVKHSDPEVQSWTGDYIFFPQQKTISLGINISF